MHGGGRLLRVCESGCQPGWGPSKVRSLKMYCFLRRLFLSSLFFSVSLVLLFALLVTLGLELSLSVSPWNEPLGSARISETYLLDWVEGINGVSEGSVWALH